MTGSGLRVRCLASTRIAEQLQEELEKDVSLGEQEEKCKIEEEEETEFKKSEAEDIEDVEEESRRKQPTDSDSEDYSVATSTSASTSDSDGESKASSSNSSSSDGSSTASARICMSCIQEAQLSPDGTCVFTTDYNRTFSVYPIDTDILQESGTRPLKPYAQFSSPDPIWAFASNPLFDLNNASSTHLLVSRRDRYITLHNALWDLSHSYNAQEAPNPKPGPVDISTQLAGYKLIDHLKEEITAPISLTYSSAGTHFFAGSQNKISIFDLEYTDNPTSTISTIPSKRSKLKGGGRGFKGYISALALSSPASPANGNLLAAGARTRYIGIYNAISGEEVTHFSLPGTLNGRKVHNEKLAHVVGDGVSFLKWSPCSRYLYVAERQSDVILIYDVRNFSLALGHCAGRKALTKQKLGFDVWLAGVSPYDTESISHEIWAGGTDGKIRVWRDPCLKEGAVEADDAVEIGKDMPVVGTLVHPYGNLAVAASGVHDLDNRALGGVGNQRGGRTTPSFREWGCLDILGLGGY